ncbi:hypothetical protein GCM10009733_042840 [Nonomuraea maheshkhaliensis]|uniref:Protein kinase domain-containing protein n=1 Tax=Nonomuraea maheshkhaliensis TaxID=419590 RepID=A0ABP4RA71_9ACTN
MGDQGATLAEFVRTGGPLSGQALHRLAVSCVAAMAKLHAHGTAGLRLSPESVALGTRGQVLIGWRTGDDCDGDDLREARDVRDWADLVVFAATGAEHGDTAALTPALRIAIERCRHPDPASRPKSVDVLRVLLSRTMSAAVASVDGLLRTAG